ncbi:16S rRNA (cytosine(1402)-N(4))-methyltransferase, partial [Candidatus Peregrinibacteria bacterium]|nr:16S rRNA (cytosine(1402)-N(4))-methyltransferase [Candidatus Peregrinibacteria bacterium]
AKEICRRRKEKRFDSTVELAEFIENVIPGRRSGKRYRLHTATKVFQALRIEVNDELNALKEGLKQAVKVLETGGRIVIISYHSLEDRIVKQFFKKLLKPPAGPEKVLYQNYDEPIVKKLTKKPVTPTEEEIGANPRSRSAKLRAYEKLRELK